jgi:hypothetical protein
MPTNNPTVVVNQSDGIVGIESDGQQSTLQRGYY